MYALSNLFDYYMLLTLKFEAEDKAEFANRTHERFISKVDSMIVEMESGFSTTIFNYLVMACAGEARHGSTAGSSYIPELDEVSGSRNAACKTITRFNPITSLDRMITLFDDYDWSSAYGGHKWAHIAKFAHDFGTGKINAQFFIDHIVDLAHNGGFAFDKDEALRKAGLYANLHRSQLVEFLNVKTFAPSLLRVDLPDWFFEYFSAAVGRKVVQYYSIFRQGDECPAEWMNCRGQYPTPTHIEWGDDELSDIVEGSSRMCSCYACGDAVDREDAYYDDDGDAYCYSCWTESHWQCYYCDNWHSYNHESPATVDGNHWCTRCAANLASYCNHCEEYTTNGVEEVDGEEWWCSSCLREDAEYCECCGNYTANGTKDVDGDDFCETCHRDHVMTCALCGEEHHEDKLILDKVTYEWVCDHGKCYEKYAENPNILYEMQPALPTPGQLALGI